MLLQRLEALPVGSFHYKLLVITGLGWLFDAMDTGLIVFVLPVLGKEWGLSAGQMGAIGSIGLVGMAIGAVIAGSIADKFGRKAVFSATVILYSIATGLCAVSWSYESLLIFRFFVGFGLGGELPVAATLMSEYAPTNLRGRFIVLLESFWGVLLTHPEGRGVSYLLSNICKKEEVMRTIASKMLPNMVSILPMRMRIITR